MVDTGGFEPSSEESLIEGVRRQVVAAIAEADLRRKYNVLVIAILDELQHTIDAAPAGDYRLLDNHALLVLGKTAELARFRDLL